jgi:hypothetical protein
MYYKIKKLGVIYIITNISHSVQTIHVAGSHTHPFFNVVELEQVTGESFRNGKFKLYTMDAIKRLVPEGVMFDQYHPMEDPMDVEEDLYVYYYDLIQCQGAILRYVLQIMARMKKCFQTTISTKQFLNKRSLLKDLQLKTLARKL